MKIVINSNIFYKKALNKLFDSLHQINFKNYNDIIVVIGQSVSKSPFRTNVKYITDLDLDQEVTCTHMDINNYDYTAYHALYLYKDHTLIKDLNYLYLLDTIEFHAEFIELYDSLKDYNIKDQDLFICPNPHSNICCFGSGVIDQYKDNFGTELSKQQAIILECNRTSFDINNKKIYSITNFGNIKLMKDRICLDEKDIYNNGIERKKFYYPDLGISKWILWGKNGDFVNNIQQNF